MQIKVTTTACGSNIGIGIVLRSSIPTTASICSTTTTTTSGLSNNAAITSTPVDILNFNSRLERVVERRWHCCVNSTAYEIVGIERKCVAIRER